MLWRDHWAFKLHAHLSQNIQLCYESFRLLFKSEDAINLFTRLVPVFKSWIHFHFLCHRFLYIRQAPLPKIFNSNKVNYFKSNALTHDRQIPSDIPKGKYYKASLCAYQMRTIKFRQTINRFFIASPTKKCARANHNPAKVLCTYAHEDFFQRHKKDKERNWRRKTKGP